MAQDLIPQTSEHTDCACCLVGVVSSASSRCNELRDRAIEIDTNLYNQTNMIQLMNTNLVTHNTIVDTYSL